MKKTIRSTYLAATALLGLILMLPGITAAQPGVVAEMVQVEPASTGNTLSLDYLGTGSSVESGFFDVDIMNPDIVVTNITCAAPFSCPPASNFFFISFSDIGNEVPDTNDAVVITFDVFSGAGVGVSEVRIQSESYEMGAGMAVDPVGTTNGSIEILPPPGISIAKKPGSPGQQITLPMALIGDDVVAISTTFSYDGASLDFDQFDCASTLPSGHSVDCIVDEVMFIISVNILAISGNPAITPGEIGTLAFDISGSAPTGIFQEIFVQQVNYTDTSLSQTTCPTNPDVNCTMDNGEIDVVPPGPNLELPAVGTDFGPVLAGSAPSPIVLTLTNSGTTGPLTGSCGLSNFTPSQGIFMQPSSASLNLAPGESIDIEVNCDSGASPEFYNAEFRCTGTNALIGDPGVLPFSCDRVFGPSLAIGSVEGLTGQSGISLPFTFAGDPTAPVFEAIVEYDDQVLTATGCTGNVSICNVSTSGEVLVGSTNVPTTTGELFRILFDSTGTQPTVTTVDFNPTGPSALVQGPYYGDGIGMEFPLPTAAATITLTSAPDIAFNVTAINFGVQQRGGAAPDDISLTITNTGDGLPLTGTCSLSDFSPASGNALSVLPGSTDLNLATGTNTSVSFSCDDTGPVQTHTAIYVCTGTNAVSGDPTPLAVSCDVQAAAALFEVSTSDLNLTPTPTSEGAAPPIETLSIMNAVTSGGLDLTNLSCSMVNGSTISANTVPQAILAPGQSTEVQLQCDTAAQGNFDDIYRCNYDVDGIAGLDGPTDIDVSCLVLANQPPVLVTPLSSYSTSVDENLLIDVTPFFADNEGDPLTFSLSGGSSFAMDDPTIPGLIRGTTTTSDRLNSPLNLTLIATDPQGSQAPGQTVTIVVEDEVSPQFEFERFFPALQQPWYFSQVTDIEAFDDGTVYVADAIRGKVSRFSKDGLLVTQWGELGAGDGEFTFLQLKLGLHGSGQVFVASGTRLQVFSRNGVLDQVIDYLEPVVDVTADDRDQLYILFENRVEVRPVDQLSDLTATLSLSRPPSSLAVNSAGRVFVAQRSPSSGDNFDQVIRFDPTDAGYTTLATFPTTDADDLSVDDRNLIYAVGDADSVIRAYNANGALQLSNNVDSIASAPLMAATFGDQNRSYISTGETVFGVDGDTAMRSFAWQASSGEAGRFDQPLDVTVDGSNNIYVAGARQSRVQKFSSAGVLQPLSSWDLQQSIANPDTARVSLHATSDSPTRVVVSTGANLETYDSSGQLISPDPFASLQLVAPGPVGGTPAGSIVLTETDGPGTTFYVVSRTGQQIESPWQAADCRISDLTVSPNGLLYLLCEPGAVGPEIQVFTQRGERITNRTLALSSGNPRSIASDDLGRIYLLNTENQITPGVGITSFESSIRVFRSDLTFLDDLGTSGYSAGRFNFDGEVAGISVNSSGSLVVAEPGNNRVQVLKPEAAGSNNKAIIVAGGGDYPENFLWEATQMNTNNAYDKLIYQGFTAERILYLHPDSDLDLDGNPNTQEIDGAPTLENLARAFGVEAGPNGDPVTDFAVDADNLVVYFADHGDKEVFRVNPDEVVSSAQVSTWLSTLQDNRWPTRQQGAPLGNNGWLTVIYEACESGTFMNELAPLNSVNTNKRLVVTTSSSDQNASFIAQGLLSFSYQFWINIFNGNDVLQAHGLAAATIADAYPQQEPLLRLVSGGAEISAANQEGFFVSNPGAGSRIIGNGTTNEFAGPQITAPMVSLISNSSGRIDIESVDDADGVSRVWAIIEPPDFLVRDAKNPILELPTVDLEMNCGSGIEYCGTFDGFTSAGDYRVEILAQDIFGNVTRFPNRQQSPPDPLLELSVGNPLKNKAALLVAGDSSSRGLAQTENGDFAYQALLRQDFANDLDPDTPNVSNANDEVRYFNQSTRAGADVGVPSIGQLNNLVTSGFAGTDTQHFVLILTADSGAPELDGLVLGGSAAPLLTTDLQDFLDDVEGAISGKILVVLEGSGSGALLPRLVDGSSRRIVIASASSGEKSNLVGSGGVSFSKFFWNGIRDGFSVGSAFQLAATATSQSSGRQQPLIDDNGNGIGNDRTDGLASRTFFVGPGIARAGNGPLISSTMPDLTIAEEDQRSAQITADNVTSTSETAIAVVGNVSVPGTDLELGDFNLNSVSNKGGQTFNLGTFQGTFDGFLAGGDYDVTVFAVDELGSPSSPQVIRLRKTAGADFFEVDDTPNAATPLVADAAAQRHTLHETSDEDWLLFYLTDPETRVMDLSFRDLDPGLRLNVEVYDASRLTNAQATAVLQASVDPGPARDVNLPQSLAAGLYLTRINRQSFSAVSGSDPSPGYSIGLSSPFGDLGGLMRGTVVDSVTGNPVGLASATALSATGCGSPPCESGTVPTCDRAVCGGGGGFRMFLNQGPYSLRIRAPGYEDLTLSNLQIEPGGTTEVSAIELVAEGGNQPPVVILGNADAQSEGLTLSGMINANGVQTTGRFLIGPDASNLSPLSPGLLVTGNSAQDVTATAIGLNCNSNFVVVLQAENAGGQSETQAATLSTGPCTVGSDALFRDGFE